MWELLLLMFERLGIIVMVAFVMTRIPYFRQLLDRRQVTLNERLMITILFGFFGMIGTYTGLSVTPDEAKFSIWTWQLSEEEALANSRVIGVVVAGMLGGWRIGAGAGLIAGIHRFSLGGFTAFACGISTMIAGMLAGLVHHRIKKNRIVSLPGAFFVGALSEAIQMGIILLIARPWEQALGLVQMIGIPMILANGAGAMIFILIIRNVIDEEERFGARQSERALRIADRTLRYLRKGLTPASAKATCDILVQEVGTAAVSITDRSHILAFEGAGSDHHQTGKPIDTPATKQVLATGKLVEATSKDIACPKPDCPLHAGLIMPLMQGETPIGTLKFYVYTENEITNLERELVQGISRLLSHQLELARVDELQELANQAEVRALQAQVSPHFLFNALNVITSMIRVDANKARSLLLHFSQYLRKNLTSTQRETAMIHEEIDHVKAYLAIQEARFPNQLQVTFQLDEQGMNVRVPAMTFQPLVENAMEHGFRGKRHAASFQLEILTVMQANDSLLVTIRDNGAGMKASRLKQLKKQPLSSSEGTGLGIYNVDRRLRLLLGEASELQIQSEPLEGTTVSFVVKGDIKHENHSHDIDR